MIKDQSRIGISCTCLKTDSFYPGNYSHFFHEQTLLSLVLHSFHIYYGNLFYSINRHTDGKNMSNQQIEDQFDKKLANISRDLDQ